MSIFVTTGSGVGIDGASDVEVVGAFVVEAGVASGVVGGVVLAGGFDAGVEAGGVVVVAGVAAGLGGVVKA
jgi:hypothetical protein